VNSFSSPKKRGHSGLAFHNKENAASLLGLYLVLKIILDISIVVNGMEADTKQ
jgi:hypothetical protein